MVSEILLNGQWKFREAGTDTWLEATVPGDVHIDIYNRNIISDPYYADNFKQCDWIITKKWEYTKEFEINQDMLYADSISVIFRGIDTFSDIYINESLIGSTDNMFLQYKYDIKPYVRVGANVIKVVLKSTTSEMEKYPYQKYFSCFNLPRIFTRKAQCHFGWDWAPNMPGYGIWQDVVIRSETKFRIRDVNYRTKIDGNITFLTELSYNVRAGEFSEYIDTDELELTIKGSDTESGDIEVFTDKITVKGKENFINIKLENPRLWYPNGIGEPYLYSWELVLTRDGKEIDRKSGRLGIREVQLLEEPLDTDVMGFRLKINGYSVYCKGSNWVPAECFTGTIKDEKYKDLIYLARSGNINLLRVWGGGIYEKDIFYNLCDENGIMVWQDIMFACADIPDDNENFKKRVIEECTYQVKRLRNHPSIVYWCGGNEKTGTYGLMKKYGEELVDYTVRGICNHLDPTRPYVRQSPYSLTDVGNDMKSGDTHANSMEPSIECGPENFRKTLAKINSAFISESAILGPCRYKSIKKFIPEDKIWPTNVLWEERFLCNPYASHSLTFLQIEKLYAERLFGEFTSVQEFIKKAMAAHGEVLRSEAEYHRAKKWSSGGFVNWMFNDTWPTGTWSIIDYYLEPKVAYYLLKRAFENIKPIFSQNCDGEILLSISNDTTKDIKGNLVYGGKTLDGRITWQKELKNIAVPCCGIFSAGYVEASSDENESFLFAVFTDEDKSYTTTYFHKMWKQQNWAEPEILVEVLDNAVLQGDMYSCRIRLTATASYARMVNISLNNDSYGFYSDNFFDIMPGESREVVISSREKFVFDDLSINHWLTEWE